VRDKPHMTETFGRLSRTGCAPTRWWKRSLLRQSCAFRIASIRCFRLAAMILWERTWARQASHDGAMQVAVAHECAPTGLRLDHCCGDTKPSEPPPAATSIP